MSIGVLVAVGTAAFEPALLECLRNERVHVTRRCVDLPDLLALAASRQAEVALVAATLPGLDAEAVAWLERAGVATVGVVASRQVAAGTPAVDGGLTRLGIEVVVAADDPADVIDAVVSAAGERPAGGQVDDGPAEPVAGAGRVVAVWGPTGAPGRSTVALGVGAALARQGRPTLVVDADVYGGTLAQMLGLLDESSGLLAATREANRGRLVPTGLAACCRQVDPMLRVLTGLPRADRWVEARSALVRSVLLAARSLTEFTVVDCGFSLEIDEEISYDTSAPRRNGATVEVLTGADLVLVVGRADPIGLGRLIRGLGDLNETVPGIDPVVVLNRVRSDLGWTRDEIADTLHRAAGIGRPWWLPEDAASCGQALIEGRTLQESAPGARLTRAFAGLASRVSGAEEDAPRSTLARVLRR